MSDSIENLKDKEIELPKHNQKTINATNKYEIQQIIDEMKMNNGGIDKISAETLKII